MPLSRRRANIAITGLAQRSWPTMSSSAAGPSADILLRLPPAALVIGPIATHVEVNPRTSRNPRVMQDCVQTPVAQGSQNLAGCSGAKTTSIGNQGMPVPAYTVLRRNPRFGRRSPFWSARPLVVCEVQNAPRRRCRPSARHNDRLRGPRAQGRQASAPPESPLAVGIQAR